MNAHSGTLHVMPRDDDVQHQAEDDCACGPRTEPVPRQDGSMGWLVVHHALDGRETGERTA